MTAADRCTTHHHACACREAEFDRMREALELISSPLGVDGLNHMADVNRARQALHPKPDPARTDAV